MRIQRTPKQVASHRRTWLWRMVWTAGAVPPWMSVSTTRAAPSFAAASPGNPRPHPSSTTVAPCMRLAG